MKRNCPFVVYLVLTIGFAGFLLTPVQSIQAFPGESTDGSVLEISDADREMARKHFQSGQTRFAEGRFREAIEHFDLAYDITRAPEILYNIGRCHEELGELARAVEQYELYLRLHPTAEDQEEVRSRIDFLEYQSPVERPAFETAQEKESAVAEPSEDGSSEKERKKRVESFILGVTAGPAFVLVTPQLDNEDSVRHPYFGVDILGHLKFKPWFYVSIALAFAGYMETKQPFLGRDATSHVGVGGGVTLAKHFDNRRLALYGRLMVIPVAINRHSTPDRAGLIAFQGALGLHIALNRRWGLLVEGISTAGPVFVANASAGEMWRSKAHLDVGGRVGVDVEF